MKLAKTVTAEKAKYMSFKSVAEKIEFVIQNKLNIVFSSFWHAGWTRVHARKLNQEIMFNDIDQNFGSASYYISFLDLGRKMLSESDKSKLIDHAKNGFMKDETIGAFISYLKNDSGFC